MSNSNYKLPGLPKLPPLKSGAKNAKSVKAKLPASLAAAKKIPVSSEGKTSLAGLTFGTAPKTSSSSASSGSQWSSLAGNVKSGGLSGVFGSTGGFSGIASIFSGIAKLFGGGKTTPAPLVPYLLPLSQVQNVALGGTTSSSGVRMFSSTSESVVSNEAANAPQVRSEQIVQAVKQALLTSSSLNDIISEI